MSPQRLDCDGIRQRVPHGAAMCLLDTVLHWDAQQIVCSAAAVDTAHPLARDGRLAPLVAAEYAAQASAVHGALLDGCLQPRPGLLARLNDLHWTQACIDADDGPLRVHASLLARGAAGCAYRFELSGRRGTLASGRLTVAFTAAPPS